VPDVAAAAYRDVPADVAEAFTTLHLLPTAWPELVKSAKKIAAKRLHPDRGGAHGAMVRANLAAEQAELWATQHDAGGEQGPWRERGTLFFVVGESFL
jgi:hypothetical protein